MSKELKYFNGLAVIRVRENEEGIQSIRLADNTAIVMMEDGTQRTIISPYIELRETHFSIEEKLKIKDIPVFG